MKLKERKVTIPELMLIGGTRVALGLGIGLLIKDKLNKDQRQAAGLALLIVGAVNDDSVGNRSVEQGALTTSYVAAETQTRRMMTVK